MGVLHGLVVDIVRLLDMKSSFIGQMPNRLRAYCFILGSVFERLIEMEISSAVHICPKSDMACHDLVGFFKCLYLIRAGLAQG